MKLAELNGCGNHFLVMCTRVPFLLKSCLNNFTCPAEALGYSILIEMGGCENKEIEVVAILTRIKRWEEKNSFITLVCALIDG